jgi:hypothetical protein
VAGRQRIDRVRRQYNQWVANQTLEDYALRFTAKSARRWSAARVANTALGAISFLALEAIGGTITLNYGVTNATAAILVVSVIIFCCGLPIAYHAAKCGIDIDLLTRGAGFGYIGSTITSLIYASFTFIFFAIEAVILATALELCLGIPRPVGYLISAIVIIPLVTYGITLISRFQLWTQPIWIILHILPFVAIAYANPQSFYGVAQICRRAATRRPSGSAACSHRRIGVFAGGADRRAGRLPAVSAARPPNPARHGGSHCSAPARLDHLGALKLLLGSFLAYFALEPRRLQRARRRARAYVSRSVSLRAVAAGSGAGADRHLRHFSQIKINVTNAYAGSIVVEFLFPPHPQPSRPRGLVGVQRAGRAAVDGDRRLQGAGADAGAVLQRRHRLGRRAGRRSRGQQAARPAAAADGVQARASLRHQSGRRRRHEHRHHRLDQRVLRPVRTDGEGAGAVRRAGGGLRHGTPDRLGHRRQVLHRAQAEAELAEHRSDPVLYLRAYL